MDIEPVLVLIVSHPSSLDLCALNYIPDLLQLATVSRTLNNQLARCVLCPGCRCRHREFALKCHHRVCGCLCGYPLCPRCKYDYSDDAGTIRRCLTNFQEQQGVPHWLWTDPRTSSSSEASTPRYQATVKQMLLVVDLDCLLVHRSHVGELDGAIKCDGYDGSGRRAPFYVRPGAFDFLSSFTEDELAKCGIVFASLHKATTCIPIVKRFNQALAEPVTCYDQAFTVVNQVHAPYDEATRHPFDLEVGDLEVAQEPTSGSAPQRQFDLDCLRINFNLSHGTRIRQGQVFFLTSDRFPHSIRKKDRPFSIVLPIFGLDQILDVDEHFLLAGELQNLVDKLKIAVQQSELQPHWHKQVLSLRKPRPYDEQYDNPPRVVPSAPVLAELVWKHTDTWLCAEDIHVFDQYVVHNTGSQWRGARRRDAVANEAVAVVTVVLQAAPVVRVGWALSKAREVGTDEWGYGFCSLGWKAHNRQFEQIECPTKKYGTICDVGDRLTSILDRRSNPALITFQVNERKCGATFQVPNGSSDDFHFAICGQPGFRVKLCSFWTGFGSEVNESSFAGLGA